MSAKLYTAEVNGKRTLPLYVVNFRLIEDMPAFESAKAEVIFEDPDYSLTPFASFFHDNYQTIAASPIAILNALENWLKHISAFENFVQYCDDSERVKSSALKEHSKLVRSLGDVLLQIDTMPVWNRFIGALEFHDVHRNYRNDPNGSLNYESHAERLKKCWNDWHARGSDTSLVTIDRLQDAVNLRFGLQPNRVVGADTIGKLIFISYAHRDEAYREKLEQHLSSLKRENKIACWHDRRITGGAEWRGVIDQNLDLADIILLLISRNFLASSYCNDVEVKAAIRRHKVHSALVIPVILSPCDWKREVFGALQAVPKDGTPIALWQNEDEAFLDVIESIRRVVDHEGN